MNTAVRQNCGGFIFVLKLNKNRGLISVDYLPAKMTRSCYKIRCKPFVAGGHDLSANGNRALGRNFPPGRMIT